MREYRFVFGPVPSRRMGLSIGISPIPKKTCNYSCVYCQLGRTHPLIRERKNFFNVEDILVEVKEYLKNVKDFDVITIVGEGEPTLYKDLEALIVGIKSYTQKPVAVITNGGYLVDEEVRRALMQADLVLPSLDAYDEESFKKIDRPSTNIEYEKMYEGLVTFSKAYKGKLWMESMIIKDVNDDEKALEKIKKRLEKIQYDRLYINTPIRPPAESWVKPCDHTIMRRAENILGGVCIDLLDSKGFHSEEEDDYEGILSIIKRHPMNQYEIKEFLKSRHCEDIEKILYQMDEDTNINKVFYKGYTTYRLK